MGVLVLMLCALLLLAAPEENLDVATMNTDELIVEETRLMHPPSLSPPAVMMLLGFAVGAAGFTVMALNMQLSAPPGASTFGVSLVPFLSALGGITGTIGAAIMAGGMLIMSFRTTQRAEAELRLDLVRSRLDASGRVPLDRGAVRLAQLRILDKAKPGPGPAVAWLTGGIVAVLVGVASALLVNSPPQTLSAGVAEMSAGGVMIGVGIWQLIARDHERSAIEDERRRLISLDLR